MKTLSLLVIATLTFSSVATARTHSTDTNEVSEVKANIFAQSNGMVFVQLENPVDSKVKIAIIDQDGNLLHTETIKEDVRTVKRYDISNLPAGTYSYSVYSKDYSVKKKIEKK